MKLYFLFIFFVTACQVRTTNDASEVKAESLIESSRLNSIKSSLPIKISYTEIDEILKSNETFWYDHESLKPAYQASITESPPYGANSNDDWFSTIASSVKGTARVFYDEQKKNFKFPFAATAGTDNSTNLVKVNFISLPKSNGSVIPIAIKKERRSYGTGSFTSNAWGWLYPKGAVVGEALFIKSLSGALLPFEIRTRTRFENSWAVNVYKPFPTAAHLARRIHEIAPNWKSDAKLSQLMTHLSSDNTLTPSSREAAGLPGVFNQSGFQDALPEFSNPALVEQLLKTTPFISAYGLSWKSNANGKTFAPTTTEVVSIVPNHYEAGLIEINEQSCARCHSETGRHLSTFDRKYGDITLYGEMWGRDGIFSFNPFNSKKFPEFWNISYRQNDNRQLHPTLEKSGIIEFFNASKHSSSFYPAQEFGGASKRR